MVDIELHAKHASAKKKLTKFHSLEGFMRYALLFLVLLIAGCDESKETKLKGSYFIECPGHERIIGQEVTIKYSDNVVIQ